ncbi:hypothetical protein EM6_0494 [Asticcacaulis excentricus]|uniref:Uncharacterized protein n=2 Tax=Asticcacaulis excentricus TaxID=78587 RepID=A0A3G9FZU8_9CAUL|nr:hypothetical protein EM6_0494 [Asticcacaulis excentricus]
MQTTPPRPPIGALGGEFIKRQCIDSVELAAAPVADRIFLGNFLLEAILDPYGSDYSYDALGASTTLSIGDTANPAALAAAASTASAGTRKIMASVGIEKYPMPLWQVLGYASLEAAIAAQSRKNGTVNLYATIGGAAATGTVTWQIKGCDA